jgi:hypothetical protein
LGTSHRHAKLAIALMQIILLASVAVGANASLDSGDGSGESALASPLSLRYLQAHRLVGRALAASGGEARIRALHTARAVYRGQRHMVDQSFLPEGSPDVLPERLVTSLDFTGHRSLYERESHFSGAMSSTIEPLSRARSRS